MSRLPDLLGAALLAAGVGALSFALVEAPDWGWNAAPTYLTWVVAAACLVGFVAQSARHPSPVVAAQLVRVRAFAWSNVTALVFAVAFAIALLSTVLWLQQVWHYSAIRTGLAIAPGPLMVPIFAAAAHRLSARVPVGVVVAVGCLALAAGSVLIAVSVGREPAYATQLLPGWLIGGVGVGFALPAILSAATADLPPNQAATGSGIVSMSRQIGTAIGVSVLVAVLGTPTTYPAAHTAFQRGWWVLTAVAVVGALAAVRMTPPRRAAEAVTATPTSALDAAKG